MRPPYIVILQEELDHKMLADVLLAAPLIHTGEWQAMDTRTSPLHATHELLDVTIVIPDIPDSVDALQNMIHPDLPWADEHFAERVSGWPYNPAPSHTRWPYAVRGNGDHIDATKRFDHTYPERFWPKFAGSPDGKGGDMKSNPNRGIRFRYGDLMDVVNLLVRNPYTRQAFLPVWFPEDTGAVDNQRVPCTLGYHFMIREGKLSARYYIRSCDIYRHLANDLYMACRLVQWVADEVNMIAGVPHAVLPDGLIMHISSLHLFVGDRAKVIKRVNK